MNNYFSINLTVKGIVIISVLTLAGGCATQTKKTEVPAPLESEMRSIADQKASTTYQPQIQSEKATYYVVKKGDTLWRISKNYGAPANAILKANHMKSTKDLKVGQKLSIPVSGKSQKSPSSISRSSRLSTGNTARDASSRGFIWPVKGKVVSKFGDVRNGTKNHGISILPQAGQNVVAAKEGTIEAVSGAGGDISVIVIKHEGGIRTLYESCCNPVVGEGSHVETAQTIANIHPTSAGKSQEITFKVYVKDKPVNPMTYLSK